MVERGSRLSVYKMESAGSAAEIAIAPAAASHETWQFRWLLICYHCGTETERTYDTVWYDSIEQCEKAADELSFDYCCSYKFEFQKRVKPQEDQQQQQQTVC